QINGEEVDTRTDVWAFGCLLYEMLTARPVFRGRSVAEVFAAILRDEPDLATLPDVVPVELRRLIRRCLRKEPAERLQHLRDVRPEMSLPSSERAAPGRRPTGGAAPRWLLPGVAGVAIAGLVVATLVASRRAPRPRTDRPLSLSVELPKGLEMAHEIAAPFAI